MKSNLTLPVRQNAALEPLSRCPRSVFRKLCKSSRSERVGEGVGLAELQFAQFPPKSRKKILNLKRLINCEIVFRKLGLLYQEKCTQKLE